MTSAPEADAGLSVLTLGFEVVDDRPDWPVVTMQVDGHDPFAAVASGWRGFDPAQMLGSSSPLVPLDGDRRVAVYRCTCGEAGCGVIAPFIVLSPDGKRISWVDFRDYVGVFVGPAEPESADHEGTKWNLPDLHFDRDQYLAEVARASADRSWETSRRRTARLVSEHLLRRELVVPPDLVLRGVSPAFGQDGVSLNFLRVGHDRGLHVEQQLLRLRSDDPDPDRAADDIVGQLLAVAPADWASTFG